MVIIETKSFYGRRDFICNPNLDADDLRTISIIYLYFILGNTVNDRHIYFSDK